MVETEGAPPSAVSSVRRRISVRPINVCVEPNKNANPAKFRRVAQFRREFSASAVLSALFRASVLQRFSASVLPRFRASVLPRFRASAPPCLRASAPPRRSTQRLSGTQRALSRLCASAFQRFRASALLCFRASALQRFNASTLQRFNASTQELEDANAEAAIDLDELATSHVGALDDQVYRASDRAVAVEDLATSEPIELRYGHVD